MAGYDRDRDRVDNNTQGRVFENGANRVRDGRAAGYDGAARAWTYERPGKPAIEVGHEAPERRLAEMVRDVGQGRSVEDVLTREALARSHAAPAEEAARLRSMQPEPMTPERHRDRERERGVGREPQRGR